VPGGYTRLTKHEEKKMERKINWLDDDEQVKEYIVDIYALRAAGMVACSLMLLKGAVYD